MNRILLKSGHEISYFEQGQGPLLFLIHGFGGTHSDWQSTLDAFTPHYRVIIPDFMRQYMQDPKRENPLTFFDHVEILHEFVKVISHDQSERYIVGASYGGALTWGVLIHNPELFKAAVLVGPMPCNPTLKFENRTIKVFVDLARHPLLLELYLVSPLGKIRLPLIESIFHAPWIRPGRRRKFAFLSPRKAKLISHVIRSFAWIVRHEDWAYWESRFHRIKQRVQILYGSDDRIFKEGVNTGFARAIPGAEVKMIDNCGHLAMLEQPKQIAEEILKFFKTCE
ncbi:MAG: alpha/beta hydrolase [Oligoflexia bacterium]|nr:alpha/beta hydrolase [Oligoflexia bacterium]